MAKAQGEGKLCLFMAQSPIEKELNRLQAERLFKKLSLAKPDARSVDNFDLPLIPQQEDFYLFPWRHISQCIVGGNSYKATDFSEGTVLKKSAKLLEGKPAYLNHNQIVGEEIGVVGETEFVGSYKNAEGLQVPGGIEAPFVIDSKIHPKLVRQLSSPVSPIDSASVTTLFKWEASHDFEHDGDFFWHLGEEVEGSMVRRIVKQILTYEESSMVWMGADPFAKMLDEKGHVVNIDKAAAYSKNKFSADPDLSKYDPRVKYYVFDCLDNEKLLHLSNSSIDFSKAKTENTFNMEKDLLDFLAAFFATTPEKLKAGEFKKADAEKVLTVKTAAEFSQIKTNADGFETLKTEKGELDKSVTSLTGEVATLKADKKKVEDELALSKPKIDSYAKIVTDAKAEAKRVYGIFAKGKPEKAIEDELEAETDLAKIETKIKMFGGSAISEFGGTCNKCNSKDISFRSSKNSGEDDGKGEETLNMNTLANV